MGWYIHISPRDDNCDDNDESYTQYPGVVVGRSLKGKWGAGGGGGWREGVQPIGFLTGQATNGN